MVQTLLATVQLPKTTMPCYHPITGYQHFTGGRLSFNSHAKDHNQITIPCGQCSGCRLKASREWATRCMHEKQMHKYNCTITLTYDEKHLPDQSSVEYKDFQRFMKYLRKALGKGEPGISHTTADAKTVRFYMGAEYGEQCRRCGNTKKECKCGQWEPQIGRPHYHACLFGITFNDQKYDRTTDAGFKIYTSETLQKLWTKGFSSIGELTFESAAYIARYIMKKRTGDKMKSYEITDAQTGEIQIRKKEFNQMSRKPGIGATWLQKYKADSYPHGKVIIRGHKAPTPRYYDKQYQKTDPDLYDDLKHSRKMENRQYAEHQTDARLAVQEHVQAAKTRSLKRKL